MPHPRSAGILLHPTSLPGPGGIGTLGPDAHRFADVLADARVTLWQMLPLGPTGYGDSPYQCFSAFAGNPLLIALPNAADDAELPAHTVAFEQVIPRRRAALARHVASFVPDEPYRAFVAEQAWWLDDFALFMALKGAHGGVAWHQWEPGARDREPAALAAWRARLSDAIEAVRIEQYLFFTQYAALRAACAARGIRLMGDLPIYVAHDSADVWAQPHLFQLHPDGRLRVQAGVPPDYFSADGQLWGNPLYDWAAMRAEGFAWWIRRLRAAFAMFDLVRVDHFRGFEAYWEVAGDAPNARDGRWVDAPGAALFEAATAALGPMPIVAENLGVITPGVEAIRARFGYPGMSILQFAFGTDPQAPDFKPHNYVRERVAYTGTHDNDTALGWWRSTGAHDTRTPDEIAREKAFALQYLATDGREMHWALIRAVLASVADTVIVPLQDVLGLGSEARMNTPGRAAGNWRFRFTWDQLAPDAVQRLRTLIETYDR